RSAGCSWSRARRPSSRPSSILCSEFPGARRADPDVDPDRVGSKTRSDRPPDQVPLEKLVLKKLVLYHGQCLDGFAAAWVAFRAWGGSAAPEAGEWGASHRHDVAGRDVLLLDFAYPRDEVVEMKQKASSLVVLDHHVTAQQDLAGLDYAHFDLERSGATIAW